jgi:hypothetical protein
MDIFELPSVVFAKRMSKAGQYDESKHPRDAKGRWSAAGAAAAGAVGGAAALGLALATRNPTVLRHARQMRRAYTGYRSAGMGRVHSAANTGIGHAARQAAERGIGGPNTALWTLDNAIARGVGGAVRGARRVRSVFGGG